MIFGTQAPSLEHTIRQKTDLSMRLPHQALTVEYTASYAFAKYLSSYTPKSDTSKQSKVYCKQSFHQNIVYSAASCLMTLAIKVNIEQPGLDDFSSAALSRAILCKPENSIGKLHCYLFVPFICSVVREPMANTLTIEKAFQPAFATMTQDADQTVRMSQDTDVSRDHDSTIVTDLNVHQALAHSRVEHMDQYCTKAEMQAAEEKQEQLHESNITCIFQYRQTVEQMVERFEKLQKKLDSHEKDVKHRLVNAEKDQAKVCLDLKKVQKTLQVERTKTSAHVASFNSERIAVQKQLAGLEESLAKQDTAIESIKQAHSVRLAELEVVPKKIEDITIRLKDYDIILKHKNLEESRRLGEAEAKNVKLSEKLEASSNELKAANSKMRKLSRRVLMCEDELKGVARLKSIIEPIANMSIQSAFATLASRVTWLEGNAIKLRQYDLLQQQMHRNELDITKQKKSLQEQTEKLTHISSSFDTLDDRVDLLIETAVKLHQIETLQKQMHQRKSDSDEQKQSLQEQTVKLTQTSETLGNQNVSLLNKVIQLEADNIKQKQSLLLLDQRIISTSQVLTFRADLDKVENKLNLLLTAKPSEPRPENLARVDQVTGNEERGELHRHL